MTTMTPISSNTPPVYHALLCQVDHPGNVLLLITSVVLSGPAIRSNLVGRSPISHRPMVSEYASAPAAAGCPICASRVDPKARSTAVYGSSKGTAGVSGVWASEPDGPMILATAKRSLSQP